MKRLEIFPESIDGYHDEKMTHSEVALAVAQGLVDTGLGVQAAALSFGLDFAFLTTECYDLAFPEEKWGLPALQALARWLTTAQAKSAITDLGGYDINETGRIEWVV